jgi:hypothetical protein
MQLKLVKYFMPRPAAAESSATGFSIFGARLTSPGKSFVTGTLISSEAEGAVEFVCGAVSEIAPLTPSTIMINVPAATNAAKRLRETAAMLMASSPP